LNFRKLNKKTFYSLFFFLLFFPQITIAESSSSASCVQEQLNALGFDTGKPDGVLGRKTRSALAQYEKANGRLTLRKLDADHAVVHCRQLGLRHPELKAYWPSRQQQFEFIFGDSVSPKFRTDVSATILGNFAALQTEFGLEIPLTIKVVVASSAKETLQLTKKHYKIELNNFSQIASDICSTKNGFSATAPPLMIVVCRNGTMEVDKNIHRWWFENTLAHELFHQVQYQLAGWMNLKFGMNAVLNGNGPVWMSEGSADVFSIRATDHWTQATYRDYSWKFLGESAPNLAALEREDALSRYARQIYAGGRLSVYRLVDANGLESIISFYEDLGLLDSWKAAFRQNFGESAKDFYVRMLKMDHG